MPMYVMPYWMEHHPPLKESSRKITKFTTEAATDGALDVLKFLCLRKYQFDAVTCAVAARGGHLECLQFLHESGCPWDAATCTKAAEYGHFECLKYAHEKGCPFNESVTEHLCKNSSDLDIEWLRYVLDRGCPIHKQAGAHVVRANRFDCLRLLHEYNAPWDTDTMKRAARKDTLQYVQYLYEHGCPWDEEVVRAATTIPTLSYLLEQGCPYPDDLLTRSNIWSHRADTSQHRLACLQYLIGEQGMYMPEDGTLFEQALLCADLLCVQYLIDQGCPCNTTQLSTESMGWNPSKDDTYDARLLPCLQYAVGHGWQYDRSIVECVFGYKFHLCMEYLLDYQQHHSP